MTVTEGKPTGVMDLFFNPRKIALVGASSDPRKLGNSILMNLLTSKVRVYPVTRSSGSVAGMMAYRSLADLPEPVDLVLVAIEAKHCPGLMDEIRRAGARNAVIFSGGFGETGTEGAQIEETLVKAAKDAGVRFLGPNCVGVSNSRLFNGTFTVMPERGRISLVSQSGALGGVCIYITRTKNIGLNKFVGIGNAADVDFTEILDYLGEDSSTSVIAMYMEGVSNGRAVFESLRNTAEKKPVVILKGGRSEQGGKAVKSHTGSLAGSTGVFTGMIQQAGCVTAPTLDTLLEICKFFDYQPLPTGRKICIISNTGGAGVLAADAASDQNLTLSLLNSSTRRELHEVLSPLASVENPIDVVATGGRREYQIAAESALRDRSVDVLLVICAVPTFAGMTEIEHAEGTLEGVRTSRTKKPVVGVWLAGDVARPGKELLEAHHIPCYDDPALAIMCISRAVEYAQMHSDSTSLYPERATYNTM